MNVIRLSDAKKDQEYFIEEICVKNENIKNQLKNLGIIKNEKIKFLNYNYGKKSLLIKVMNINYAIDKSICDDVKVRYE